MRGLQVHTWGLCLILAVAGCANVTAVPVKPGSPVAGIRIYDVKPLLVVSGDNVSLLMVPNYNRAYALKFSTFLAKHDFEATFQNGFLTNVISHQDTTAVALALVQLITEVAKSGPMKGKTFAETAGGSGNRFGVYDIVFDRDGNIIGLQPLVSDRTLMKMPLRPATATPSEPPGAGGASDGSIVVN